MGPKPDSNSGPSSSTEPESVPLMPMDNNHMVEELQEAKSGLSHVERVSDDSNDVVIDMNNPANEEISAKKKTTFPPGFDIEKVLDLACDGESERRKALRQLFQTAVRTANIDCAVDTFGAVQMEIKHKEDAKKLEKLKNETKNRCLSLLQWSAVLGLDKLVPALLHLGANPMQVIAKTERTVPMIAAGFNHASVALKVLESSNEEQLVKKETSELDSLIEIAAANYCTDGDKDQGKQDGGLIPELLVRYRKFYLEDPKGSNQALKALSEAIKAGNFWAVKSLVDNGVPINKPDLTGIPPLVLAIQLERDHIVEFLSSHKSCDVNVEAATKDTPLMVAARCKRVKFLEILLNHSNIESNKMTTTLIHGPKTALKEAAYMENSEHIELLINSGANVVENSGNKSCNALLHAIEKDKSGSTQALIGQFFQECLGGSMINSKNFEDTLMACVFANNSDVLKNILEHESFGKCLHKYGGRYVLWKCLMCACQKGLKDIVMVLVNYPLTPKVTCRADLTCLAETSDSNGRTPLHCLAGTCLDEEIIDSLKGEDKTPLDTNWLLIRSDRGKTVMEHFSREETLLAFLGLEADPKVKWVESLPANNHDIFKEKYSKMDQEILKIAVKRFPIVADAIIKSMVVCSGWGIHDDNLEVAVNWQIINDAEISVQFCSNTEDKKYSDILRIASEYSPDLLQNPIMKMLQRHHWRKLPNLVFRVQMVWAFLLALLTTVAILEWKAGSYNTIVFSGLLFMGIASLFLHFLHIFGGIRAYMSSFYNYIQFVLYVGIILAALIAFRQNCKPEYENCEEIPEIVKKNYREKFCWFSFLILVTWQNFFKVIQRSTILGLYSIMFQNAFVSFLGVIFPLVLLIFSFGITFYALYAPDSQTVEVDDFQGFLMKIAVMTIGSVDSTDMGLDTHSGQYNPRLILAIFFVVSVTVITFNLLTGLVIKDVNEALDNSKLFLMQLRIEQISETEVIANILSKMFPRIKEKVVFCSRISVFRPNQNLTGRGLAKRRLDLKLNSFMSRATIHDEILEMAKK